MSLWELIEVTRREMFEKAKSSGFASSTTVEISQKLDHLLDLYQSKYLSNQPPSLNYVTVHGSIISNILDGLISYGVSTDLIVKNNNILCANPDQWYSLNQFSSIFSSFEEEYNQELLMNVGKSVPNNSLFPGDVDSFEDGLLSLNCAYKLNHSCGIDGYYKLLISNRTDLMVICNTAAYSASFNLGILKGLAQKFNKSVKIEQINAYRGGEFKVKINSPY
jgi:hypothetical protein